MLDSVGVRQVGFALGSFFVIVFSKLPVPPPFLSRRVFTHIIDFIRGIERSARCSDAC